MTTPIKKTPLAWVRAAVMLGEVGGSMSGPFGQIALKAGAAPVTIAFYRMLLTTLVLLPWTLRSATARKQLRTVPRNTLWVSLLSGALLAGHFVTWYIALQQSAAFSVATMFCMQILFVMVGAWIIHREKPVWTALPGALLALGGAVWMAMQSAADGSTVSLSGDLLALLSAAFYGSYFLCGRSARKVLCSGSYTVLVYGACALILAFCALIMGVPFWPQPMAMLYIIPILVVGCTLLGHSVFNWSLGYVSATFVSLVSLGEPLGAALWVLLLTGTTPKPAMLLGSLVVAAGMAWYLWMERRNHTALQVACPSVETVLPMEE